jgi:hypothetical protein
MDLTDSDLLPGEASILTKKANFLVSLKKENLRRLHFTNYIQIDGSDAEAVGGKAHLTNYRLLFKSHALNRLRGTNSVWLPSVTSVNATFVRLVLETEVQRFEYVMWFKTEIVQAIKTQVAGFTPKRTRALQKVLLANPQVLGPGLERWATVEKIDALLAGGKKLYSAISHLDASVQRDLAELLNLFNLNSSDHSS